MASLPEYVRRAIYGEMSADEKRTALDVSTNNWWREYAARKNDEEEEHVADTLLYDERCHLPRTTARPDVVPPDEKLALRPYRLVAVDMDGTFLDSSGHVSPRSKQLAAELQRRGVHFVIATGRPTVALQPLIDEIGLASVPAITFNGACLQQVRTGLAPTPIWANGLCKSHARRIVEICSNELKLGISYSMREGAWFCARDDAQRQLLARYEELEGVRQDRVVSHIDELFVDDGLQPLKIVALTPTPDAHAEQARFALRGYAIHVIAAQMHIEFVNEGVNKASALSRLATTLGVPLAEAVAFGDSMNDVEMLDAVGLGIAMANAREEAKAVANQTSADSNDQDGVARYCEQLMAQQRL